MIDGPSEFTETYSRTSTANWNSDMTSSVEVSGKIYKVKNMLYHTRNKLREYLKKEGVVL